MNAGCFECGGPLGRGNGNLVIFSAGFSRHGAAAISVTLATLSISSGAAPASTPVRQRLTLRTRPR